MIIYGEHKFKDYVDFFYWLVKKQDDDIEYKLFPHHTWFYIRAAIEQRTGKRLTIKKIKQLIKEELALKTITLYEKEDSQSNHVSC